MTDNQIHSNRFTKAKATQWVDATVELVLVAVSLLYVFTSAPWALFSWIGLSMVYFGVGLVVVWGGELEPASSDRQVRFLTRWTWVLPILSSLAGANSAIIALVARGAAGTDNILLAFTACLGVVLSWTLLHVGFAHVYLALSASEGGKGIEFPGDRKAAVIDFLYFAFTIGTAFATSDARITSLSIRRVALIHSILSFFYNALVVAVALQVLQQLVIAN
jgi:uncharacterized membrane protein